MKKKKNKYSNSWNYFWKRTFTKKSTWIILLLHIIVVGFLFLTVNKENGWFMGNQWVEDIKKGGQSGYVGYDNPTIKNVNDFFACVFPNLIFSPILTWSCVFSPISWLFWWQFDDIGQKTQTDGTDLFFLTTETRTSREKIFWGKLTFLVSVSAGLYLLTFALPLFLLLWKAGYFSNFTGLQLFLFLGWNFLVTPLFFFIPLVIFFFSLASLNSFWYIILKWFGRLSLIFIALLGFLVLQALYHEGGIGKKIIKWCEDFFKLLSQNYLLTTLAIIVVVICLAVFALFLAYKDFQKKDLQ